MSRDTLVVVKDVDVPAVRPHPEPSADQTMGRRVVSVVDDDVAIRMELGFLPHAEVEGRCRKIEKPVLFDLEETGQRTILGRSVDPRPGGLLDPFQELPVGLDDVSKVPPRQEVSFDVMDS